MKKDTQFVEDTMKIISSINEYKSKYGDIDIIRKYYIENNTFEGIVEYLHGI